MQRKYDLWRVIPMQHSPGAPDMYTYSAKGAVTQHSIGWWSLLLLCCLCTAHPAWAAKCLFVSSYHQGYAWSDGVERGLRPVLQGHCELKQFDMDAKRHKEPEEIAQKALEAKALIEAWRPTSRLPLTMTRRSTLLCLFIKTIPCRLSFAGSIGLSRSMAFHIGTSPV